MRLLYKKVLLVMVLMTVLQQAFLCLNIHLNCQYYHIDEEESFLMVPNMTHFATKSFHWWSRYWLPFYCVSATANGNSTVDRKYSILSLTMSKIAKIYHHAWIMTDKCQQHYYTIPFDPYDLANQPTNNPTLAQCCCSAKTKVFQSNWLGS